MIASRAGPDQSGGLGSLFEPRALCILVGTLDFADSDHKMQAFAENSWQAVHMCLHVHFAGMSGIDAQGVQQPSPWARGVGATAVTNAEVVSQTIPIWAVNKTLSALGSLTGGFLDSRFAGFKWRGKLNA